MIDAATNTVTATVAVGGAPRRVAFSPDGDAAYVTASNIDTVAVIADDSIKPKNKHELPLLRDLPKLVGSVIGGGGSDGGGWLVIGNHAYKIPPRPLRTVIAAAVAPYVGEAIKSTELQKELRKLSGPDAKGANRLRGGPG